MPIILKELVTDTEYENHKQFIKDTVDIYKKEHRSLTPTPLRRHERLSLETSFDDLSTFKSEILKDRYALAFILHEADLPVGLCSIKQEPKTHSAQITFLFIRPEFNNKGIEGIVLEQIFVMLKKLKCRVVLKDQNPKDRSKYKLLKSFGFESYTHCMYKKL